MSTISTGTRRELVRAVADRYQQGTAAEKRLILDEFVALTGYHRKHTVRVVTSRSGGLEPRRRSASRRSNKRSGPNTREERDDTRMACFVGTGDPRPARCPSRVEIGSRRVDLRRHGPQGVSGRSTALPLRQMERRSTDRDRHGRRTRAGAG